MEKYNLLTTTSHNWKTHNQIDCALTDRRWHLSILQVQPFRTSDHNTDHYVVVALVRERLSVSKCAAQKFCMDRFNLKKINGVEVREQHMLNVRHRFELWTTQIAGRKIGLGKICEYRNLS
jgi:hypothetical protein